ncbi:hypothetical protein CBS14141_000120 [Malassezia furfur]|nr:hypothetical protein CBS14141_000120 [Malassezia furfur]
MGTASFRTGTRIVARARLVGSARTATFARAPQPLLLRACGLHTTAIAHNAAPSAHPTAHTQQQSVHPSSGALGSDLKPADMLAFLNSEQFSSYRSLSGDQHALLGDNAALAVTALTHESWMYGMQGHNRRLAFLGRRALKTYLSLYLFDVLAKAGRAESLPEAEIRFLQNILSSPQGVDNLLRTQTLGDHVGRSLQLERVMRWHPTIRVDPATGTQETGLFKVRGACVEAVMGAIYHYRGAQVAQQFFLSRILPNLSSLVESCPKSLQEAITKTSNEATEALHHSP